MQQASYWSIPDYYELTLREFSIAIKAKADREERNYQTGWEQARWIARWIVQVNVPKKQIPLEKIARFPWEGTDFEQMKDIIDNFKAKKGLDG